LQSATRINVRISRQDLNIADKKKTPQMPVKSVKHHPGPRNLVAKLEEMEGKLPPEKVHKHRAWRSHSSTLLCQAFIELLAHKEKIKKRSRAEEHFEITNSCANRIPFTRAESEKTFKYISIVVSLQC
jgi:hypothetical protein